MRRRSRRVRTESALGLFALLAVVSLVPVLVLGVVLAASYHANAASRGLAQARAQAGMFARTSIEPRLADADLSHRLTARDAADLDQMGRSAVAAGDIERFRIRSLDGQVVYSSDGSDSEEVDDEALAAAKGRTVAELTHLDADARSKTPGVRVAEVYAPLTDGRTSKPVGVLELYLPYDPIAADVGAGLRSLYRDLGVGLVLLYVVLAGISWSVTRRLRAQVVRNAHLAAHDQLTGLPNRMTFRSLLEDAVERAGEQGQDTAVAILDIDRFKEVNDTLGHRNGDALLVEVGRRLQGAEGNRDVVARLGGDQFGVIFGSADPTAVHERIAAMQESLGTGIDLAGVPVGVEVTLGLARAPEDGVGAETLLRHADVAVFAAKERGMKVARYAADADPYDAGRMALIGDLRRAIRNDELTLHFQPKVDVRSGAVETVEALIRWNHPERGLLMPDQFLPVVEQTGMIDPMTAWVLDAALTWVAGARHCVPTMRVAVNVSARNLIHAGFAAQVTEALDRHGCAADCLAVEVTETALVADPQRAEASLRRLALTGVRISVDDFGRGQTSLSQLASMPLDEVKIDKSFVVDMDDVHAHAAIVQSVIDLAHRLGFEVVAEGVEDREVLDALRRAGCDIAQGYHIARPMAAASLEHWLIAHDATRFAPPPVVSSAGRHRRDADDSDLAAELDVLSHP